MSPTDIRTALAEQRKARASWGSIIKATVSEWIDDDAMTWAAAVACYAVLALAPLLVIAIKVIAVIKGGKAAGTLISTEAVGWMGPATAQAIDEILKKSSQPGSGVVAALVSAALVVLSVGGVFAELQQAMNRIWKIKPTPGRALWRYIEARLISVMVMAVAALLLLGSLVVATWLENVTWDLGLGWKYITWLIDAAVSIGLLTLLFAMLYRTAPDANIAWRVTWLGAFITAVLFQVGKYALAAYFKFAAPSSAFGAVGSLAAILIWIYYSAQIVFFGAEFTQVYAKQRGPGVRPSKHAQFLSECDETETATPSPQPPGAKPPKPVPRQPWNAPSPAQQYAAVLAPHAGTTGPAARARIAASVSRQQAILRTYLAAGATLAVGALIGGYGALAARNRPRPGRKDLAAARLDERINRIEQKVSHASQINRFLEKEDVIERIDALEQQIRRAARKAKPPARWGGRESWTRRVARAARSDL